MPKSIRARRCPDCCEITFPAPVTIRDNLLPEGGKQCPACRSRL